MQVSRHTLSAVREASEFARPPRVLVMAEESDAGQAVALVETLEAIGADAEVRFSADVTRSYHHHHHPDAVIVAGTRGYRFTRHHAGLARALRSLKR